MGWVKEQVVKRLQELLMEKITRVHTYLPEAKVLKPFKDKQNEEATLTDPITSYLSTVLDCIFASSV